MYIWHADGDTALFFILTKPILVFLDSECQLHTVCVVVCVEEALMQIV